MIGGDILLDAGTILYIVVGGAGVSDALFGYSWGSSGGGGSFVWEEVATPVPAALPLFATGLGGLSLLGWRRKRRGAALAA